MMKTSLDLQALLVGFVLGAAPFFLTASNLADFSEVKSAAAGGGLLAVIAAVKMIFK